MTEGIFLIEFDKTKTTPSRIIMGIADIEGVIKSKLLE